MEAIDRMKPIILASSSPRRKELLAGLGLKFTTHSSDVDEETMQGLTPDQIVEQLALRKASAVASCYNEGIVIGSDTIVVLDERILGKPLNDDDAFLMLSALQGHEHIVYSGIAVIDVASGKSSISHQHTSVRIRRLTAEEIGDYIATGEPKDKAGSYAIQGIGASIVTGITGDYFTVVGLPVQRLTEILRQFGIDILKLKSTK